MSTPQGSEAFSSLSIHIDLWQQALGVKKIPGSNNNEYLLVLSLTNYLNISLYDRNCNIQSNNQPSTIKLALMKNHQDQTNKRSLRLAFYRYRQAWASSLRSE